MKRLYRPIRRVRLGQLGALSITQIQQFAAIAGFTGDDLATAVAIALAESSGNPGEVGDRTLAPANGPSFGLWQINIGSRAHPEFASWNLLDPQTNANAAFSIYSKRGGFSEWTTYTNGAYQSYLPQVLAAQPPLTIDASTGQPIEDFTPTPDLTPGVTLPALPALPPSAGTILGLAGAAIGIYLVLDEVLS